jgi:hypothetical protein
LKADAVVCAPSAECLAAIRRTPGLGRLIAIETAPDRDLILLRPATRNHGVLLRERDVWLVPGDAQPRSGLLGEMLQALHASDRIAAVERERCLLLSHIALNVIGAFDPLLDDDDAQIADWKLRAAHFGMVFSASSRTTAPSAPALPRS